MTKRADRQILEELRRHCARANEWSARENLPYEPGGWSIIGSIMEAVEEGRVGLALTRWDDLTWSPSMPTLSEKAQQWRP